jgi:type IV pilus secretin PilQ/predicted competence protein
MKMTFRIRDCLKRIPPKWDNQKENTPTDRNNPTDKIFSIRWVVSIRWKNLFSILTRQSIAVLLTATVLKAQDITLRRIECRPGSAGFEVRILCNKPAVYTSLVKKNPLRVEIYLREVRLGNFDLSSLREVASVAKINVDQWRTSPLVLRVAVELPVNTPYSIVSSGNGIILQAGKMGEPETVKPQIESQAESQTESQSEPQTQIQSPPERKKNIPGDNQLRVRLNKLSSTDLINIDLHEADIGNVLRLLARQNDLNIIASDSVRGKVTLTLQQVTVAQAMDNILRANGYRYLVDGDIIRVQPARSFPLYEMETRVYRLKHIEAGNVVEAIKEIKSQNGSIKMLTPSFQNREDVYHINRAYIRRELHYWLRSSVLIVTDTPANLEAMDKIVQALDQPVPMVMIETRLLELSPQDKSSVGIDWDKQLSAQIFNIDETKGPGYAYALQANKGYRVNYATLNVQQFNVALNFLREKTDSKLISTPRLLAMDNEPCDISVGTTFPIPSITRGTAGQGDIVTFTYKDVDIALRVIPHVTEDSTITMYVNPIIEEVIGEVKIDVNTAPITAKREVDTVVKVRSGNTVVIGGLLREKDLRVVKKVWLLGSIPLLGYFFRSTETEKVQTDLIIFLTPYIVGGS